MILFNKMHHPNKSARRQYAGGESVPALNSLVQLDIPYTSGYYYGIPKHAAGRIMPDDFVFFRWPANMNPMDYMIAVDTLDMSQPVHIRTIGHLRHNVELPHVIFDAYAHIYVLPKSNPAAPSFHSRLNRGSTYHIPDVSKVHVPGTKYQMERNGILTTGSTNAPLPMAY